MIARATEEDRVIHELWIEYKVASQFSKTWDEVEEWATLEMQRNGAQAPGPAPDTVQSQDGVWHQLAGDKIGSAQYWMQQVDVPRWFRNDELATGSSESIFATAKTLAVANAGRRQEYDEMIAKLDKAREIRAGRKRARRG